MVRGGRGYSRGGGGRGGSSYRGSGSSSYRGSSGRSSFGNSYNSSRGSSSYHYDRSKDRGRDRRDDHKRSYRNSSRDRSPDRKRSRHEDSRLSSSYSSSYRRNDSSRSSRQTPPPPSVRSSGQHRRDDSSSHRHSSANDSMGPPKSLPPRSRIVRRGGGGGGAASSHRSSVRTRGRIVRRRRESADLRIMRKKLLLANQRDRARRIKIARLTSSLHSKRRDPLPSPKTTPKALRYKKDDESKKGEDDKDTDADKSKSKDDGEEDGADDKSEEGKAKKESKGKREGDDVEGSDAEEEADDKDEEEEKDDDDEKSKARRLLKKNFIKLTCVHCRAKCLTFKEYGHHLYSRSHKLAMRRLALRQKAQLAQMRLNQRNAQRDIEESSKDETEDCKPQYCPLCRLNYRQPKAKHQLSESHRNMKKFLMPYCGTCHIAFKSPMVYETHRCSLDHIKRKARNNESANSDSSDGEKEVDLKDFMTVDSVGEVDTGDGVVKGEGEDGKEKVNVGAEHVKKIETLYCVLCRYHIPLKEEEEAVVRKHCATRGHLKAFVRFKEDESLRVEAEKIQRKQKEAREKKKEKEAGDTAEDPNDAENAEENEGGEDKIWEDVDKDLGDLLRDVGPDGDHEDDEEDGSVLNINIERFDRFKNSENQKKEVNGEAEEESEVQIKEDDSTPSTTPVKGKEKAEKKSDSAKNEEKASVDAK